MESSRPLSDEPGQEAGDGATGDLLSALLSLLDLLTYVAPICVLLWIYGAPYIPKPLCKRQHLKVAWTRRVIALVLLTTWCSLGIMVNSPAASTGVDGDIREASQRIGEGLQREYLDKLHDAASSEDPGGNATTGSTNLDPEEDINRKHMEGHDARKISEAKFHRAGERLLALEDTLRRADHVIRANSRLAKASNPPPPKKKFLTLKELQSMQHLGKSAERRELAKKLGVQ
ncbi:hypothetical protein CYMTET_15130 [Cymbomonas tetramitiformis]|uniref:Transmembrane protein n=1 Tax=Cymbomonas tetramitiformis TaxID=36881 RepID=A0AAE0GF52_9CHLO|nr:hypothetical protein CYMTET_15130 [Cymbomonas tetramitiformis]